MRKKILKCIIAVDLVICVDHLRGKHYPVQGNKRWGCLALLSAMEPAGLQKARCPDGNPQPISCSPASLHWRVQPTSSSWSSGRSALSSKSRDGGAVCPQEQTMEWGVAKESSLYLPLACVFAQPSSYARHCYLMAILGDLWPWSWQENREKMKIWRDEVISEFLLSLL